MDEIAALAAGAAGADPALALQQMPAGEQALLERWFEGVEPVLAAIADAREGRPVPAEAWPLLADAVRSQTWPAPLMKETLAFYEHLRQGFVRSAEYLLLTWAPPEVSGDAIRATLGQACGRPAEAVADLPPVIRCSYIEEGGRLRPEQPGQPWIAALMSYDARGTWDVTVLHQLMALPYDVAIAVDVRTYSRQRGMALAEGAYNTSSVQLATVGIKDARAERVIGDAERVMHELTTSRLHQVQIAVLVTGATAEELDVHVAEVRDLLGSRLRLMRVEGAQRELLKLWSATPSSRIDIPSKRRAMLSDGLGCLMGVIGYHRPSGTSGLLWGIDGMRRAPLFYDLFAGNQAAHMVVLGKTGFGKTFFINMVALRAAALLGYRVITIDAFKNAQRLEAAAGAGVRINWIGITTPINILDVVFDEATEGGWIPRQVQHVISQLSLLLGTPGEGADGRKTYVPRALPIAERGVLDRALTELYAAADPQAPPVLMPLLSDLIAGLEALAEPAATALAQELRYLIYGSLRGRTLTQQGRAFNAPTAVDWRFAYDINCFDFSEVPSQWLPFYYAQAVGAINRFMRDPRRDGSRRTLLIIDEFGLASQVESVGRLAADICKVARKYGIGLLAVDQNPATFLGSQTGREIFENAAAKVLFHLDDLPARAIGEAVGDLTDGHLSFLSEAGPGQCVAVFGNDVYFMNVEANRYELRHLRGS
nr:MAG: hypothetical protein DIU80_12710 [Chloroflexota bacterium]